MTTPQELKKERKKLAFDIYKALGYRVAEEEEQEIALYNFFQQALQSERQRIEQEVKEFQNPYPKDIFVWDNKEKLKFNRGRFNEHCFKIVENMRKELLKQIKAEGGK